MTKQSDPNLMEKHYVRKRFFILLAAAFILIIILIWVTLALFDVNGIDAFNAIV